MNRIRLIIRSFVYYWRKNLAVGLGVAVSTAVLTGALVVGDSMQFTLQKLVDLRLGETSHTLTAGDRFFSHDLAYSLEAELGDPAIGVLLLETAVIVNGGQKRLPNVQIVGLDNSADRFFKLNNYFSELGDDEVIISENLAKRLDLQLGEEVLFKIRKASLIPMNAPFVSDEEVSLPLRLTIKAIAKPEQMSRFNLRNSQTAPFNAFISLSVLDKLMELNGKVNTLLVSSDSQTSEQIESTLQNIWNLPDIGLRIDSTARDEIQITSDRVFFDEKISRSIMRIAPQAQPVLTYFVNSIVSSKRSAPYSFVSGIKDPGLSVDEIFINTWLADDLSLHPGDSVSLNYFEVGPLRKLADGQHSFIVKQIVEMDGLFANDKLMPDLPGLSDVGNCRDWDTGVPIDLESIRDKDEAYWDDYRGTPKAFISLQTAEDIWANRFGDLTAIRLSKEDYYQGDFLRSLRSVFAIKDIGFVVKNVREQGKTAARNGVNFGELFLSLSFFVLLGGIILSLLLFGLTIQSRIEQLGLLRSLGFSRTTVQVIMIGESTLTALMGGLLGLGLTLVYNKMIFAALNSIWNEIIRSDLIFLRLDPKVLLLGISVSVLISIIGLSLAIRRLMRKNVVSLTRGLSDMHKVRRAPWEIIVGALFFLIGVVIVTMQIAGREANNPTLFFVAGGLFLIAFLLLADGFLRQAGQAKMQALNVKNLVVKNIARNRLSSLSVILMLALGTFLIVAVGANRKNHFAGDPGMTSGTGGYTFFGETTVPILEDLNNPAVRRSYNLSGEPDIVQFRQNTGDDASCLNLNAITQPRILGVNPDQLSGRFSFASSTEWLDDDAPWRSLNHRFEGNMIAGIADQTTIQWSLLKKVGDTLWYTAQDGEEFGIILIGGLASSIFQGNLLISDEAFLSKFPGSSGSGVFLIQSDQANQNDVADEFNMSLRDYGISLQSSKVRLADFSSIENTYLSIFLLLGALGLLIGTLGLGIVLARNIQQRQQEIALQRAVGIPKSKILSGILIEYSSLMILGILIGSIAAIVSILPGLMSRGPEVQLTSLIGLIAIIIANGLVW
ncbi:MAG: FtsX-like permease family protein, partial [Bacteroidales bacterium]|nr:FtsX-like permease family protein [Bacteroidales bacterium]